MSLFKSLWHVLKITRRAGGVRGIARLARSAPKYALLFRRLFADPRVPVWSKAMVVAAAVFAVSPLNLPGYIPVVGQLDDLGIVLFVGSLFFKQIPPEILAEHKRVVGLETLSSPL